MECPSRFRGRSDCASNPNGQADATGAKPDRTAGVKPTELPGEQGTDDSRSQATQIVPRFVTSVARVAGQAKQGRHSTQEEDGRHQRREHVRGKFDVETVT